MVESCVCSLFRIFDVKYHMMLSVHLSVFLRRLCYASNAQLRKNLKDVPQYLDARVLE